MAEINSQLPPPTGPWAFQDGKPTTAFGLWAKAIDAAFRRVTDQVLSKATTPEAAAGVEDTHYMTPAKTAAAIAALAPVPTVVFSKEFISAQQTITLAGALTLPHGLAAVPKLVNLMFVNTIAELNYTIGDIVPSGVSLGFYVSVVIDATNLNIRYATVPPEVQNKTTGVITQLTPANWKAVFSAWA